MSNIKPLPAAVLFDLDGTLLDTANDLGEALNYVLTKHGLPLVAREDYRPVASDGAKGLLELGFKEKLIHFDYEQLRAEFLQYYQDNIATHTCLYSGVSKMLTALNELNIPWGIITNKPEGLTKLLLPYFSELDHSQVMIGGDSLPERKPHPLPLLHACRLLNVAPAHCWYIGDALRDIQAGNNADMLSIVAKWGYIKADDDCKLWEADLLINSPEELLNLLC
jgi:phosphoglycolate phosphatase